MVRDLPAGTVTFLFTDVEGSTRLLHELGAERYAAALGEHRRVLRDSFTRHGGVEVDTQGDAFFVAFATAPSALAAAREAGEALAPGPVRVRVGLHTGTPLVTDEGYVGADVHRAARIAAAGHGGQVLVSASTAALVGHDGLRDLGEYRLKDLLAPERLHQLGTGEFPPLRTLYRTNLPVQPTPLIGRHHELAAAGALLREHRLVTLIGPGGSGKTRLALQLAADAVEEFEDGVFWVALQAVRDPDLVLPTIAQSVGAKNGLGEFLRGRKLLLLLDNLEQLVEAAPVLAKLLGEATGAKVLGTSREPLRVRGEQRFRVEPLPETDAATLFLERARSVDPSFAPSRAVGEICGRLDGLPLALELAAARAAFFTADQLLARLDRALPLLTGGARDVPERQRTLRATIEWSYELLDEREGRLFEALSVFAGSFDLEAAEAVCEADVDTLQSLVDKSLVRRWGSGRLGMLETIHEFASERLAKSAESVRYRRGHAEYFLEHVQRSAEDRGIARNEETWARWGAHERANVLAALESVRAFREPDQELRLALGLARFHSFARVPERRTILAHALERGRSTPRALQAAAFFELSELALAQGDLDAARAATERSIRLYSGLGDKPGTARALLSLGGVAASEGNVESAASLYEEADSLFRAAGDWSGVAGALGNRSDLALREHNYQAALEFVEEAIDLVRRGGRPIGGILLLNGAQALHGLGETAREKEFLRAALERAVTIGDRSGMCLSLMAVASALGDDLRPEVAARVLGGAERLLEDAGFALDGVELERYESLVATLTDQLGGRLAAERARGRAMADSEAIALARESID